MSVFDLSFSAAEEPPPFEDINMEELLCALALVFNSIPLKLLEPAAKLDSINSCPLLRPGVSDVFKGPKVN